MKQVYVSGLISGMEFTDTFLVKQQSVRTDSRGKDFLDITLGDKTGDISAKKWDISPAEIAWLENVKIGEVLMIKASVDEWNGNLQLRLAKIGRPSEDVVINMTDYIKTAPEAPADMYAYIHAAAEHIGDNDFKAVALQVLDTNKERLLYYPAAAKNHHAIHAGLLWHMKRMLMLGEKMCEVYKYLNRDILLTGVIIHDMEKLNEMNADESGVVSEYTFEGVMLGHLVSGVAQLETLVQELGTPYEKQIMLQHMVIAHHLKPEFGSPKAPLFPEAAALHYLDIFDSEMYDFEDALSSVNPGTFTDKVRTLDGRKLYKRSW